MGATAEATTTWKLEGEEVAHCNCDWGCPCQFNANPTHGQCHALVIWRIDKGEVGDVNVDGLVGAVIAWWPGPIHEGGGHMQLIVDEGASQEQREALIGVMSAEHGGLPFDIFMAVTEHLPDPIFAPIEFEVDRDARISRVSIPGIAEGRAEPIKNPVDGSEHRARIVLPDGFEYTEAEVGNTVAAKVSGGEGEPYNWTLENTYAQLNHFEWTNAA
jgi:hypothetical protein